MALQRWTEVSEENLLDYKVFHIRRANRRSPRTGREHGFFILDTLNWTNVVAVTKAEELVMVRQYRHGTDEFTLEIPGGVVDEGEAPLDTARRELREETGYTAEDIVQIGCCAPNPAFQTNSITTFLATGCELEGDLIQDHGEDIEVVRIPVAEVEERVLRGEFSHALVLVGLYFYRLSDQAT